MRREWIVPTVLFGMAVLGGITQADDGGITWFDLITEDATVAQEFYGPLFGWQFEGESKDYWIVKHDGHSIGGIAAIRGEEPDLTEDLWLAAIEVDDVDACARAAKKAGGQVHQEPETVPGHGRYAVIVDPQSAPFTVWTPERPDRDREGSPGDWTWAELWTNDPGSAVEFYKTVLDVKHRGAPLDGKTYHVFTSDGEYVAGILKIPFDDVEPNWVPFILVDDVQQVATHAKKLGGKILLEPQDGLQSGRLALIADPSGAAFFVKDQP